MTITRSGFLFVVATLAAACHARPPLAPPVPPPPPASSTAPVRPPPPPPPPAAAPRPTPAPPTEEELFRRKSLADLNAEHPLGDVFFDYDQDVLRDEAKRVLQQDARWLNKWPQTVVRVDGHCDERGTAEYNLALGDRRASTVRIYLTSLGVKAERIQTRSLGKEVPFCRDPAEACWSQNRRGHFVVTAK
jgi:peptidoglycan-associated lipoprotein